MMGISVARSPFSLEGGKVKSGGGNGNPLQYSCLGNPMDRGAWQATVHGITMSWTRMRDRACTQG